jgi:RNA polymerase sigma-70 factor (ECF subfamily)
MEMLLSSELSNSSEKQPLSFDELYKEFAGFVYNVALRIAANATDAEELTQEVFITVLKKVHTFSGLSSIKTWLYRVTVNTTLNYLKKKSRGRKKEVELDDTIAQSVAGYRDTPDDEINKSFASQRVNKLLDSLPQEQKVCIVLRELEGLSYEEISEVTGVNINTVRTRIKRAREMLIISNSALEE